jgi:hypothetical protein
MENGRTSPERNSLGRSSPERRSLGRSSGKELAGEKLIGEKLGRRGGHRGEDWPGSHRGVVGEKLLCEEEVAGEELVMLMLMLMCV